MTIQSQNQRFTFHLRFKAVPSNEGGPHYFDLLDLVRSLSRADLADLPKLSPDVDAR